MTTCAREGCCNPVVRKPRGRPPLYCSPACRQPVRPRRLVVELVHPETSHDGRPVERVWSVRLRRGRRVVVVADALGWPSAHALAGQLEELLSPRRTTKGGAIE